MKAIRRMMREPEEDQEVLLLTEPVVPMVRKFGAVNWLGMWTLASKETHRFLAISVQTILSPTVMTLLFYAVFAMGLGVNQRVGAVPLLQFVIPGLVMMSMAQSAFVNTSVSLILSKLQGNMVDVLMPPLSAMELTIGYTVAGVLRGLAVGLVSIGALGLFAPIVVHSLTAVIGFAVLGSLMLSLMGLITGIWGDKFDHLGGIQNFVIMPATFLSGTFFAASSLPEQWQFACYMNPFFYMIDGFRYGFLGTTEGGIISGVAILVIVNLCLFNIAYWMFARGTGLKT